jgi:hypothetical protein
VKWSLHAREEIIFELLQYLRGNTTKSLLEAIRKDTRQMIEEQEAVRGRLFTIQDVMQSTVRAWLQVNTWGDSFSGFWVLIGNSESLSVLMNQCTCDRDMLLL